VTVQYGDHLGAMYVRISDQMTAAVVYDDETRQLISTIALPPEVWLSPR
jgi:hypothetical protein